MATGGNKELSQTGSIYKSSDVIYDYNCTLCIQRKGAYTEATNYCPECDVYSCKPCLQYSCDHGSLGKAKMNRWGKPFHPSTDDSTDNVKERLHTETEKPPKKEGLPVPHAGVAEILPGLKKFQTAYATINRNISGNPSSRMCVADLAEVIRLAQPSASAMLCPKYGQQATLVKIARHDDAKVRESTKTSMSDSSKVRVVGPGIENGVLASCVSSFTVDTQGAGKGQLTVRVRGPKGSFAVYMYRDPRKSRAILCKYDPTECGLYVIHVKWSGVDVPGSPFHVRIYNTQEELEPILEEQAGNLLRARLKYFNALLL